MEAGHSRKHPAERPQPGPGSVHQLRQGHQTLFRYLFLFGELTANEKGKFTMKNSTNAPLLRHPWAIASILCLVFCAFDFPALAYPPAPYHTIYGLVRDQYGTPFVSTDVRIILVSSN